MRLRHASESNGNLTRSSVLGGDIVLTTSWLFTEVYTQYTSPCPMFFCVARLSRLPRASRSSLEPCLCPHSFLSLHSRTPSDSCRKVFFDFTWDILGLGNMDLPNFIRGAHLQDRHVLRDVAFEMQEIMNSRPRLRYFTNGP
jgi:hypothetical protein